MDSRWRGFRHWPVFALFLVSALGVAQPSGSASVSGRALDSAGRPIPGVTVELAGPVARSARTDGGGRFAFDALPARPLHAHRRDAPRPGGGGRRPGGGKRPRPGPRASSSPDQRGRLGRRRRARKPRHRARRHGGRSACRDPRHEGQQLQGRLRADAGGPGAASLRRRRKPVLDPRLGPAQQLPRPRRESLRQRDPVPGRRRLLGLRGARVHGGQPRGSLEGRERAALRREHVGRRRQPGNAGSDGRLRTSVPHARRLLRLLQGPALVGRPSRHRRRRLLRQLFRPDEPGLPRAQRADARTPDG